MLDIPLGKALVPIESKDCIGCYFDKDNKKYCPRWGLELDGYDIPCGADDRKDGKNVIFKLIDYTAKETKE